MDCELVKEESLSGTECSIYSVYVEDWDETLFDRFLRATKSSFKSELKGILSRLKSIGHETGAREQFFKTKEGKPGDGVCALYDDPYKKLRLYCIRYGKGIVVLGCGGEKGKEIKALQEDETLRYWNTMMRKISAELTEKIKERELVYNEDGDEFLGDFKFRIDEPEE